MKVADWIVNFLKSKGVSDAFGLPGAVMLEFLYAMSRGEPSFAPHLNYHEQGAAFAACGYAQATGKVGVAYATRGPGLTNMITAVADAYYDSVPVMFFTAHNSAAKRQEMRIENNQEMDSIALMSGITKYAVRIDRAEDVQRKIALAYEMAVSGRKGPVFLDILSAVLGMDVHEKAVCAEAWQLAAEDSDTASAIAAQVRAAKRPIFLIGNGVRQAGVEAWVRELALHAQVPVLSSRTAQDIMPNDPLYFGFVGSHGTRYSNFILSKADLIVTFGNRLAFPVNSLSFRPIMENSVIIRVDVDENEFLRDVPNSISYVADLCQILPPLLKEDFAYSDQESWLAICRQLKRELWQWDRIAVIDTLMHIMKAADERTVFVCDVGNHSFWATNAYIYSCVDNRILYSGSFGTLGSGLPKAIGAHYGSRGPIVCFTGDQGFQMNIQELQFISQHKLPITLVVLNNNASAMIRDREKNRPYFLHTTRDSGYGVPALEAIADAYQIEYRQLSIPVDSAEQFALGVGPCLVEILVDEDTPLSPNLPVGNVCQDLSPVLPKELYEQLNSL